MEKMAEVKPSLWAFPALLRGGIGLTEHEFAGHSGSGVYVLLYSSR